MSSKQFLFATLFALALVSATPANAALIHIDSQAGLSMSLPGTTVAITPHPLWQPNNPVNPGDVNDKDAIWIAHQLSGYGEGQFQPFMGMTPVVSIFHSFTSGAGQLLLNVWADDTAGVYLDGNLLIAPKFTQSTCSGQPIGCLPEDVGSINTLIGSGNHTLEFKLYQVGTGTNTTSNPFGLLYTGTAQGADAPEPGAFAMVGGGLIAAGLLRKKFRRA